MKKVQLVSFLLGLLFCVSACSNAPGGLEENEQIQDNGLSPEGENGKSISSRNKYGPSKKMAESNNKKMH